jgi:hypothetical protein
MKQDSTILFLYITKIHKWGAKIPSLIRMFYLYQITNNVLLTKTNL